MPYKFLEIGVEPKKLLLRRAEILAWIGIRGNELDKVVAAGLLPWKQLHPGAVRMYRKADVKRAFLEGFRVSNG